MTAVVDASVWVALFWPDDPRHTASRSWIECEVNAEEEILIPTLAVPEVAGPIRRRTGSHDLALRAVNAMLELPSVRTVPLTEELARLSGEFAALLALKGGDAVYAALAFMENATLFSWDSEHLDRCPGHVATRMPG